MSGPAGSASLAGNKCELCEGGKFSNTSGSSTCTRCTAGKFQPDEGSSECQKCSVGKYTGATGSESCAECLAGKVAASPGTVSCTACDTPTSSQAGSGDCSVCISNWYFDPISGDCEECSNDEALCDGKTLPIPQPGFWSDRSSIMFAGDVMRCPRGEMACTGGIKEEICWSLANFSAESATCSSDVGCRHGSTGPLCNPKPTPKPTPKPNTNC